MADFDHITDPGIRSDLQRATNRAVEALHAAVRDPSASRHRCDITNALNYIETVLRQHAASQKVAGQ